MNRRIRQHRRARARSRGLRIASLIARLLVRLRR